MKKDLSIIIVNFNGEKYLSDCLLSIEKTCSKINYEIIIVDNNSQDNSIKLIEKNNLPITLIKSEENLGFGKGNNLAVSKSNGKYLLLLNNDTILLDDLNPSLELLNDEKVGAIGIKMLSEEKIYRPSTGHFPSPIRLLKLSLLTYNKSKFKDHRKIYEVDWIEGSFLLTKRDLWEAINGFDKRYFMYVEDVDLCKEIANKKMKRLFLPALSYIHFGGFNSKRENLLIEGHKMFINKHYKGFYRLLCLMSLKVNETYKKIVKKM